MITTQNKNLTAETFGGGVTTAYSATMAQDAKDRLISQAKTNGDSQAWSLTNEGDWSQFSGSAGGSSFTQTRSHNDNHQVAALTGQAPNVPAIAVRFTFHIWIEMYRSCSGIDSKVGDFDQGFSLSWARPSYHTVNGNVIRDGKATLELKMN